MLSFSNHGDNDNEHNSNVELIYWNESKKEFKFHEISFDQNGIKISKENPSKCLNCHGGDDPRPNWEPYSTWPGSYGGKEEFRLGEELVKGERKYLDEFISKSKSDPVYSQLLNLDKHFKPFTEDNDIIGGKESQGLLNYKFTESVAKLNFKRVVDRMNKNEYYNKFKYATLYTIACGYDKSPYPDNLKSFDLYYNKLGSEDIIALYKRLGTNTDSWTMSFGRISDPEIQFDTPDGSSQNLTYALLNQDKDLWSFFSRENALDWDENHFYEFGEDVNCDKLREKSLSTLKNIDSQALCSTKNESNSFDSVVSDISNVLNSGLEVERVENEQILRGKEIAANVCSQCHSGSFEQMNFFKNDSQLKKRILQKEGFKDLIVQKITSGDMPLNSTLGQGQQKDLIEYIKSFSRRIDNP
jgi:cytochrome c5